MLVLQHDHTLSVSILYGAFHSTSLWLKASKQALLVKSHCAGSEEGLLLFNGTENANEDVQHLISSSILLNRECIKYVQP